MIATDIDLSTSALQVYEEQRQLNRKTDKICYDRKQSYCRIYEGYVARRNVQVGRVSRSRTLE